MNWQDFSMLVLLRHNYRRLPHTLSITASHATPQIHHRCTSASLISSSFYRAIRMHSATMPSQLARCPSNCLSVCLSVCLSHAGILSKRLEILSNFFHHLQEPRFPYQSDGNIPTETP